jgi:hypothetical protein
MYQVCVSSCRPASPPVWQVRLRFSSLQLLHLKASNWNPGPPADAPAVRARGPNRGWIHGLPDRASGPQAVPIAGFTYPSETGEVTVDSPLTPALHDALGSLARADRRHPQLVLVLPDRHRLCYVELKLHEARCVPSGRGARFLSDWIEVFTPSPEA